MFEKTTGSMRTDMAAQPPQARDALANNGHLPYGSTDTAFNTENEHGRQTREEKEEQNRTLLNKKTHGIKRPFQDEVKEFSRNKIREKKSGAEANKKNSFHLQSLESFEKNKMIIVNRLMQYNIDYESARNYVIDATSSEELIINLMENAAFTYGQARAILRVDAEN